MEIEPVACTAQLVKNKDIIHQASFLIILTLLILHPLPVFSQVATTITPESEAALDVKGDVGSKTT